MSSSPIITRQEADEKLEAFNITGAQVYLIDIIPLIEMIWADGKAQPSEIKILDQYLFDHVAHINELAGYEILKLEDAVAFVSRFIEKRPNPDVMSALRELIAPIRMTSSDAAANQKLKESLLAVCLDIAASSVTQYPYGLNERFNPAEKHCFFEILDYL